MLNTTLLHPCPLLCLSLCVSVPMPAWVWRDARCCFVFLLLSYVYMILDADIPATASVYVYDLRDAGVAAQAPWLWAQNLQRSSLQIPGVT